MKSKNSKEQLKFEKNSISELDKANLIKVKGGTTITSGLTELIKLSNQTFCNSDAK